MNKPVLYILFLFQWLLVNGQINLVPNPSFEDTVFCPISTAQPNAVAEWYNPTSASPDYYNICSTTGAGVPENDWGYQHAQEGVAYIGVATFGTSPLEYREYMQVKLISPLVQNQYYCWSMWISLLDSGDYASNNIGFALSNNPVTAFGSQGLLAINFTDYDNTLQLDNINWIKIGGSFKAMGGEQYFTIGNFLDDPNTTVQQVSQNSIGGPAAYYFIDNVYLGDCKVQFDFPNVFTPNNDGVNDFFSLNPIGIENIDLSIINRWGECVYHTADKIMWDGNYKGINCSEGVYYVVCNYTNLETFEQETKTGYIQLIR